MSNYETPLPNIPAKLIKIYEGREIEASWNSWQVPKYLKIILWLSRIYRKRQALFLKEPTKELVALGASFKILTSGDLRSERPRNECKVNLSQVLAEDGERFLKAQSVCFHASKT